MAYLTTLSVRKMARLHTTRLGGSQAVENDAFIGRPMRATMRYGFLVVSRCNIRGMGGGVKEKFARDTVVQSRPHGFAGRCL